MSEQILPASYDEILAHTMMPVAHLTWSAAWAGIAAAAVDRARAFVRKAAHRADATMPPGAAHLTRAGASMRTLRSVIGGALQRFELAVDPVALESVDFQTGMNLLKVQASELAVATVMSAMQACGLSGYRNDGEFSVGRHLRDVLSSPIMISNDRIIANVGTASLLSGAAGFAARTGMSRRAMTRPRRPQSCDPTRGALRAPDRTNKKTNRTMRRER